MPKNLLTVLLIFITLSFGTAAHAEIFKWVDANGITHYSDSASTTRQTQTLDFGHLRRPSAPKRQFRETRKFFPGEPRKVTRQSVSPKKPRVKYKPVSKRPRAPRAASPKAEISSEEQFKEFHLIDQPEAKKVMVSEPKPDLDAEEYDWRNQPKVAKKITLESVKQKLCTEKRMLLAALQEKGYNSYYDEEGSYRLVWGGDGIYQGKRRFLNDEEVAKKMGTVMFEVEQYCDNPFDLELQKAARANWIRDEYCTVGKAVLEDLEHPFMRASDKRIKQQTGKVEKLCSELKPNQYRNDKRYYPTALQAKVVLPRYLKVKEDETTEVTTESPAETIEQLLALIQ